MTTLRPFIQTSNLPYDKHQYKLVYADGTHKVFNFYDEVLATWFQTPSQFLSFVEVLDKSVKKSTKGFK